MVSIIVFRAIGRSVSRTDVAAETFGDSAPAPISRVASTRVASVAETVMFFVEKVETPYS